MTRPEDERLARIKDRLRREAGDLVTSYLNMPGVVEIMLNPDGRLWVEKLGEEMKPVGTMSASNAQAMLATVAGILDTTITRERPILECEFPLDGSRFEAMIPPIVTRPVFTLRLKASKVFSLDEYVTSKIMTPEQREAIKQAVLARKNILVVGGTGTGKTTLTNAIILEITQLAPEHRLVIIEDTGEIQCAADNAVILRANTDVSMLQLLKATLRLRPDRILVGEVRGGEALSLLKAWNTGHPGGVATLHANGAAAGLIRMEQLVQEAVLAPMHTLIAEAVNVVVYIEKTSDGRRIKDVLEIQGYSGKDYLFSAL